MKFWFMLVAIALAATAGAAEEKRDISITVRNEKPATVLEILEHLSQAKVTAVPEVTQLPAKVSFSIKRVTRTEAVVAIVLALREVGIKVERTGDGYHATLAPTTDPSSPPPAMTR